MNSYWTLSELLNYWLIFGLKIKLRNIWGLFKFSWCLKVFVLYPWCKFAPILLKFKSLLSKNSRCSPVKQNWAMLWMPHPSCSKCNMKLIQQLGEERLLVSKQKHLALTQQVLFPWRSVSWYLNLLLLWTPLQQNLKEWLCWKCKLKFWFFKRYIGTYTITIPSQLALLYKS